MDSKPLWTMAFAVAALMGTPMAQAGEEGGHGNCNNYGVQANTYLYSAPDCSSHEYVQYCDQGTGAGAGAGAGGTGGNEAEAEASAGSRCSQGGEGGGGRSSVGGPILGSLAQTETVNGILEEGVGPETVSELGSVAVPPGSPTAPGLPTPREGVDPEQGLVSDVLDLVPDAHA